MYNLVTYRYYMVINLLKEIRFIKVCWIRDTDMFKSTIFHHISTLQLSRTWPVQHINQAENPFLKWKDWFFFFSRFLMTCISLLGMLRALAVIVLSWRCCWHINCTLMEFFDNGKDGNIDIHTCPTYQNTIKEVDVEQRVFCALTWTRSGVIWR